LVVVLHAAPLELDLMLAAMAISMALLRSFAPRSVDLPIGPSGDKIRNLPIRRSARRRASWIPRFIPGRLR
jgi:hypothetical protein